MEDKNNSEIHDLRKSLDAIDYEENPFVLPWGEGKYIMAVITPDNSDPNTTNAELITSAMSVYDTILDLDQKIKLSVMLALEYIKASPETHFSSFDDPSAEMYCAWYYVENAVFRIMSVWDALAHLTNIWLQLGNPEAGVKSKSIISGKFFHKMSEKYKDNEFLTRVDAYFGEDDNTESESWRGNHKYVRTFRNSLTHRNAPSITARNIRTTADIEEVDSPLLNFRSPITFDLYRIIGDYTEASNFVNELANLMINPN